MDTTTRLDEARAALEDVLSSYRDVFGPFCWCPNAPGEEGDEHTGVAGDLCPSVPATVGLSAWVLVLEYADLDPTGWVGTTYRSRAGQSPNTSKGMHVRAAERY